MQAVLIALADACKAEIFQVIIRTDALSSYNRAIFEIDKVTLCLTHRGENDIFVLGYTSDIAKFCSGIEADRLLFGNEGVCLEWVNCLHTCSSLVR